jgi:hypothetical protein
MAHPRRAFCTLAAIAAALLASTPATTAQQRDSDDKKPSLSLKVTPPLGFSPLRVRAVIEVRGGRDDDSDFYCAGTEWDWGDGTVSESSSDCDPYEAGKSTIKRRFSADHVFRQQGSSKIVFRLKQKTKVVGSATATIQVRAGQDEFDR